MRRLSTALIALCIAVAGCSAQTTGKFLQVSAPPTATPSSSAKQTVNWKDCRAEAERLTGAPISGATVECGTVTVPSDWANVDDKSTLNIALLRIRSNNQKNRIGSLLVNPGGPGASGRELAAITNSFFTKEILNRFDIVGFDPRGVGASAPIHCSTDAQKDQVIALDPDPIDQVGFDNQNLLAQQFAAGCVANKGDQLRLFSTEQTAHDMDAIRQALAEEKINYLGYSYGTLLGAVYAQLYPNRIRTMVLDGAVDPQQTNRQASEGQAAGFEQAFNNFAAHCAERGPACKIGPDARASVNEIINQVREKPVKNNDGRLANAGIVLGAVLTALYTRQSWASLEQALDDVKNGKPAEIFHIVDAMTGRKDNGHFDNSMDAYTTIICTDDAEPASVQDITELRIDWKEKYPLFGSSLALSLLSCANWPDTAHDPYPKITVNNAPPIVVVGTTGDPATPYADTEKLANLLGSGITLTWEGEGHTAYPQTKCIRTNVDNYLLEGTPPPIGTRCT